MQAEFRFSGRVVLGLLIGAGCALPQTYTISAKPGAVNYVEGPVSIDGQPITAANAKRLFVKANESLQTASGSKAEMLLTPGVFVRLGSASSVKMISPSLSDTAIEVTRGEVVVEVSELEKENSIRVLENGANIHLLRIGLYRFETEPAIAQVLDGKAQVQLGDRNVDLGKDKELALAGDSKAQKFSPKTVDDDLYAWSKTRDAYVSAASYSAARNASFSNSFDGFGGYLGPGWAWNSGWNSWAWLPGNGAFFSPFGFGYYSPYYVSYAPVAYFPLNGTQLVPVPVNPSKPVTVAGVTGKPVIPGQGPVRAAAWGPVSNGAHVTSAAINHGVEMARSGGYSGGGNSGPSGGGLASSSSSSLPAAHSASAPASAGGGGHH